MLDLDELEQMEEIIKQSFTDVPWENPRSKLSPENYCRVSLIDYNEPGTEKVKAKCKLPVRSTPGGPFNKGAIRNALARVSQVKGAPAEKVAAARKRLETLARQAGIGARKAHEDDLAIVDDAPQAAQSASYRRATESDLAKGEKCTACRFNGGDNQCTLFNFEFTTGFVCDKFELPTEDNLEKNTYPILKVEKEGELRLVYGVVLRPNVTDLQGDFYDEDEVRKAAHAYLIKSRRHDLRHQENIDQERVQLVESFVGPADIIWENGMATKKGDWIIVSHIDDDQIWKDIKNGEIKSFSIVGVGQRRSADA